MVLLPKERSKRKVGSRIKRSRRERRCLWLQLCSKQGTELGWPGTSIGRRTSRAGSRGFKVSDNLVGHLVKRGILLVNMFRLCCHNVRRNKEQRFGKALKCLVLLLIERSKSSQGGL